MVERLVRKGTAVLVEGRLTVRDYTDREDMPRQATEIIVGGPQGMVNVLAVGSRATSTEAARGGVGSLRARTCRSSHSPAEWA